jgi:cell wall-associated NlpC family hydrolase
VKKYVVASHLGGWTYVNTDPPTRDFAGKRGDCWTFVMAVQRDEFHREAPDVHARFAEEYGADNYQEEAGKFSDSVEQYKDCVDKIEFRSRMDGDIILLSPAHGWATHAGVVCGRDHLINLRGVGVRVEHLTIGYWSGKVDSVYRPRS